MSGANAGRAGRRLAIALCIVAAFVLAAVAVDRIQDQTASDGSYGAVGAAQMVQAANAEDYSLLGSESGLPDGFEDELFGADGFDELQRTSDGSIAGLTAPGSAAAVFERCRSQMEQRGWVYVDSGQATRASFRKSQGAFSWCCVDCTEVGDKTSVVVMLERRE